MIFVVENENELIDKVWQEIGNDIAPGKIFGLQGDLGAGKTTLVKGIAKKLGLKEEITSPTYLIEKDYSNGLRHIDLYRFEKPSKIDKNEAMEWLDNKTGPTFIEWPEKIPEVSKQLDIKVILKNLGENKREVEIK